MSTQDPFAEFGGRAIQPQQQDPFAEFGGRAITPEPTNQRGIQQPAPPAWVQSIRDFTGAVTSAANPLPALKYIYENGWGETVKAVAGTQEAELKKAKAAYDKGDLLDAARRTLNWAIPIVGPAIGSAQDKLASGETARGLGESVGLGLSVAGPQAIARSVKSIPVAPRVTSRLNPAEQAAVAFGEREGIPLDLATRTNSQYARGTQNLLAKQPGAAGLAQEARMAQQQALTSTAERLRTQVEPRLGTAEFTPESAGQAIQGTLQGKIKRFDTKADEAYAKLREIESDPENAIEVVTDPQAATARANEAFDQMVQQSVDARMSNIVEEARSGATEMTGKIKREAVNPNDPWDQYAVTGRYGSGFKQIFPELNGMKETPSVIAKAIERGEGPLFEKIQESVKRMIVDSEGSDIRMALRDIGLPEGSKTIALPVDMRPVKASLKPVYEQLTRRMPIAQQQASKGLKAIENIIKGEDYLSASVADADLSAIKAIAREASSPELRNVSQGLAAKAVRELDLAVRGAVSKAGPEAINALKRGRSLTKAKYSAADLLDDLRKEPVQVFQQLTFRKDSSANLLREVNKQAPQDMPKLARAYLDGLFETATSEGGFGRTGTLQNQWQSLGPQTKNILFKNPALIKDLDNFFLLAKKIAENPNPSGTASTLASMTTGGLLLTNPVTGVAWVIGNNVLARMLYSSNGAKALVNGLRVPVGNKGAAAVAFNQIFGLAGKDIKPVEPQTAIP